MRFSLQLLRSLVASALMTGGIAAMAQQATLVVNAAWYGSETRNTLAAPSNAHIVEKVRAGVQNGRLMLPPNLNDYFGFDPFPNTRKVVAVALTYNGQNYNIRQNEGEPLVFPGTPGKSYLPAPVDSPIDVAAAWYGVEVSAQPDAAFAQKIRSSMLNGNVYVPPDMNAFFGRDPNPGVVKKLALQVRYRGQTYNLRQREGQELKFPGVEGKDFLLYLQAPVGEIRKYFDPVFYVQKYPDLRVVFGDNADRLWDHYQRFGIREGRDPGPNISISALKLRYPELFEIYGNDNAGYMHHYVAMGGPASRFNADPAATAFVDRGLFAEPKLAYFDADYYFRRNQGICSNPNLVVPRGAAGGCGDAQGAVVMDVPALTQHFITQGFSAGLKGNNIPIGPPQSANGRELMRSGDWLGVGEYITSRNGANIAVMQGDGNFSVYRTGDPRSASVSNNAGLGTGAVPPADRNNGQMFITMQDDGRLCTYKGTSPADNKGFLKCVAVERPKGPYFLHLQNDTNLLINAGSSTFDYRGYAYDFRTNVPAAPNTFGKVVSAIKVAVGCRR